MPPIIMFYLCSRFERKKKILPLKVNMIYRLSRSSDSFHILSYYIKRVTASWTYSTTVVTKHNSVYLGENPNFKAFLIVFQRNKKAASFINDFFYDNKKFK